MHASAVAASIRRYRKHQHCFFPVSSKSSSVHSPSRPSRTSWSHCPPSPPTSPSSLGCRLGRLACRSESVCTQPGSRRSGADRSRRRRKETTTHYSRRRHRRTVRLYTYNYIANFTISPNAVDSSYVH